MGLGALPFGFCPLGSKHASYFAELAVLSTRCAVKELAGCCQIGNKVRERLASVFLGDAGWEGRKASWGERSERAGGGEAPKRRCFIGVSGTGWPLDMLNILS